MALPSLIVLYSDINQKYLQYVKDEGETHRSLKFNGDSVASPCAKFAVEEAETRKGYFHIRSCYNNKYWVRSSSTESWIVAGADKVEVDDSKWSCTLFKPVDVNTNDVTIRLQHVQLKRYACIEQDDALRSPCLEARSSGNDGQKHDIFTVIDWNNLVIMPKYVAFKGDNNYYLGATKIGYLVFNLDGIQYSNAQSEVIATSNGSVRIKSRGVSKFWRRSSGDLICPDSDDTSTDDLDTLFWPVTDSKKNVIVLQNLGNRKYCKRLTDGKKDYLSAAASSESTIVREAKMEVQELVLSRYINDVVFRLSDARIYSEREITLATGEATNDTDETKTVEVKLSYTETKTSIWDSSVSLKLGVATTIKTAVPFIYADGKVKISEEYEGAFEWGERKTSTKEIGTTYNVTIEPGSTVTVTLKATEGWCDVPFSYTQADKLTDGNGISYSKDDGVYTGINCFDLRYETKEGGK